MGTSIGASAANIRVGNHRVTWNNVDLGGTEGGSMITIKEEWAPVPLGDYAGKTIATRKNNGESDVKVVLKLNEFTAGNLAKALQAATSVSSTKIAGGGLVAATLDAATLAFTLTLHPFRLDDSVLTEDWNFWKALPIGNFQVDLAVGKIQSIPVEFMCYPDTSRTRGQQIWQYGN